MSLLRLQTLQHCPLLDESHGAGGLCELHCVGALGPCGLQALGVAGGRQVAAGEGGGECPSGGSGDQAEEAWL